MNGQSRYVAKSDISLTSWAGIASVTAGVALSQFVLASEAGAGEDILQVGAPIAFGSLIANLVNKPPGAAEKWTVYAKRGAIAGVAGTAALMAAGVYPVSVDAATLGFVGLVGASTIIGDLAVNSIQW